MAVDLASGTPAARLEDMARIYTMVGEYEEAVRQLDTLLSIPAEISTAVLLIDPTWAPLKNNPRFQALIRKYGRRTRIIMDKPSLVLDCGRGREYLLFVSGGFDSD